MQYGFALGLMALALLVAAAASPIHKEDNATEINYRLPTDVEPKAYIICLVPYLENEGERPFTFDGSVSLFSVKIIKMYTMHHYRF